MREKRLEFRDFWFDFVDRPAVGKDTIHEITRSLTKNTLTSIERHLTSMSLERLGQ
jgi:hypothetical protein